MSVTKQDFRDWKQHPVTKQVFSQLQERVKILTEQLVEQAAYLQQGLLGEKAGAIKAYIDVTNIEFEGEGSDGY